MGRHKSKWRQIYEVPPYKFMWKAIKVVLRVDLYVYTSICDRAAKAPFPLLAQDSSEPQSWWKGAEGKTTLEGFLMAI